MGTLAGSLFPAVSGILSLTFAGLLARAWLERRRPYHAIWAVGLVALAVASLAEVVGNAHGWSPSVYRAWYLAGAIMVAAVLGIGELFLARAPLLGYLVAAGILLGAVPSLATGLVAISAGNLAPGRASVAIGVLGALAALAVGLTQWRLPHRAPSAALAILIVGSAAAAGVLLRSPIDAALMVDRVGGAAQAQAAPEAVRLMTPLFNIPGTVALACGAGISAWAAWRREAVPSRAVGSALILLGALVFGFVSTLERFDLTGAFYAGQTVGIVCILAGFAAVERARPGLARPAAQAPS